MPHTKKIARKSIIMPRTRFTMGKQVPKHLVELLSNEVEELLKEPQEVDLVEKEHLEEVPEEPMEEEPALEQQQGGQEATSLLMIVTTLMTLIALIMMALRRPTTMKVMRAKVVLRVGRWSCTTTFRAMTFPLTPCYPPVPLL